MQSVACCMIICWVGFRLPPQPLAKGVIIHTHLCANYLSLQMNLQNDSYSFLQNDTYNLEGESKFPVEGKYRAVSIEKFRTERDDCVTIATLQPLLRAVPTNISFGGGVKKIFGPLNNLSPFVNRRLCS